MSDSFERLLKITDTLRGGGGCPWDRRQTPESMRRYIIEEACEVVQAINDGDKTELCEELGDLLFQVVFQARMAKEAGDFDIDDVINGISGKMVSRHPHIFGGEGADDSNRMEPLTARRSLENGRTGKRLKKAIPPRPKSSGPYQRRCPPL